MPNSKPLTVGLTPLKEQSVEFLPIETVQPRAHNPRRHGEEQIARLMKIIQRMGFLQPVLVDAYGQLFAGHARREAARRLGFTHIPAIAIAHLSEADIRAFVIADNRIAELASWDEDILRIELDALQFEDLGVSLSDATAFDAARIDAIRFGGDFARPDPADAVVASSGKGPPISQAGDLWTWRGHRLACGDARDPATLAHLMGDKAARVVLADPPYNLPIAGHVSGKGRARHREFAMGSGEMSSDELAAFNQTWLEAAAKRCLDGALIYVFMDGRHLRELLNAAAAARLAHVAQCVWAKTNAGMGSFYRSQIEHVAVFKHGHSAHANNVALGRHGRHRSNLWSYPGMNAFGRGRDAALAIHPTTKPVGLLADIILDATARGERVLDPFLGSGSTLIAAERTERCCFGVEIDPVYVDAALARLAALFEDGPVRAADGAAWSDLRAQRDREEVQQ